MGRLAICSRRPAGNRCAPRTCTSWCALPATQRLITHVFVDGDEWLDSDAVFGVRSNLITTFERQESGTAPDGREMQTPYWTMTYDIVLAPGDGGDDEVRPSDPIEARKGANRE